MTTRILYNAECPVCRREIDHYREYSAARSLPLSFQDLNTSDLAPWGLTEDDAARRLHVLHEGRLASGIPAFLILWQQMPRYRWLARVVALAGIRHLATALYDRALAPAIHRWHRARKARRAEVPTCSPSSTNSTPP